MQCNTLIRAFRSDFVMAFKHRNHTYNSSARSVDGLRTFRTETKKVQRSLLNSASAQTSHLFLIENQSHTFLFSVTQRNRKHLQIPSTEKIHQNRSWPSTSRSFLESLSKNNNNIFSSYTSLLHRNNTATHVTASSNVSPSSFSHPSIEKVKNG